LYYPQGFEFPLQDISFRLILIELGREVASIGMLVAVAGLTGTLFIDRFATFSYCFGIWDITYYIFLRLFEGWPSSLLTTDLLFLIPAPWVGPVWAPVGVSIALIWAAVKIWKHLDRGLVLKPTKSEWIIEVAAGLIIIGSFLVSAPAAVKQTTLPSYPWYLWIIGMSLGVVIFRRALHRTEKIETD